MGLFRSPPQLPTYPNSHVLTEKEEDQLDELEKWWDVYNQCEVMLKAQIFTMIPDSTLIEI